MQKIFDVFNSFFSWIGKALNAFFQFILDLINGIWQFILDCFYFFLDLFTSFFNSLLQGIVDVIPDLSPMWAIMSTISPYWTFANEWVALNFAVGCLVAYLAFLAIMIPVKLIINFYSFCGVGDVSYYSNDRRSGMW